MSILKKKLAEQPPELAKLGPFHPSLWLDCSTEDRVLLIRKDYATEYERKIGKEIEE